MKREINEKQKMREGIKRHFVLGQKMSGRSFGSEGCWRQQQIPQQYSSSRSMSRSKSAPAIPVDAVDEAVVDGVGCDIVDEAGTAFWVASSESVEEEDSHSSSVKLRDGELDSGVEEANESRLRFFL